MLQDLEKHRTALTRLETQVASLLPDVQHFQERVEKEEEREVLKGLVLVAAHNEIQTKHKSAIQDRKDLRTRQTEARDRRQPLMDLQE